MIPLTPVFAVAAVAQIGANGTGKSTLLRRMAQVSPSTMAAVVCLPSRGRLPVPSVTLPCVVVVSTVIVW